MITAKNRSKIREALTRRWAGWSEVAVGPKCIIQKESPPGIISFYPGGKVHETPPQAPVYFLICGKSDNLPADFESSPKIRLCIRARFRDAWPFNNQSVFEQLGTMRPRT